VTEGQTAVELSAIATLRAIPAADSDAVFREYLLDAQRQRRLPARIIKLRAELRKAEADLWPCYLPKLHALEAQEEAERIARLEAEICPEAQANG
jgi:hypothetical protein